jgi:hypothetical protein
VYRRSSRVQGHAIHGLENFRTNHLADDLFIILNKVPMMEETMTHARVRGSNDLIGKNIVQPKTSRANIQLCDLLDNIAFDCLWKIRPGERPPNQYDPKCKARFSDLEATSRPPPMMRKLTVIQGRKE